MREVVIYVPTQTVLNSRHLLFQGSVIAQSVDGVEAVVAERHSSAGFFMLGDKECVAEINAGDIVARVQPLRVFAHSLKGSKESRVYMSVGSIECTEAPHYKLARIEIDHNAVQCDGQIWDDILVRILEPLLRANDHPARSIRAQAKRPTTNKNYSP